MRQPVEKLPSGEGNLITGGSKLEILGIKYFSHLVFF